MPKNSNYGRNSASIVLEPLRQPTDEIPTKLIVYKDYVQLPETKIRNEKSHSDIMVWGGHVSGYRYVVTNNQDLKKMHLETRKTMPKMGKCDHCGVVKERELLMVCSRCMIDQYCSRKCQVTTSPGHRTLCDVFVKAHDRTRAKKCPIPDE